MYARRLTLLTWLLAVSINFYVRNIATALPACCFEVLPHCLRVGVAGHSPRVSERACRQERFKRNVMQLACESRT